MTVYYFSACGHSLAAAEYCAGAQNAPLLRILPNGTARAERPPGTVSRAVDEGDQTAIVVFPVYCQAIPRPVRVFLRGLRAGSVILLATYGRVSHGNVLQKAQKITPTRVCGAAYLPMGHSYLSGESRMFYNNLEKNNVTPPDGETSLTIPTDPHTNLDYDLDTAVLDRLLAANREGEVHIPTSPHHLLAGFLPGVRSRVGVTLRKGANCTGCGKCTAACPFGEMKNGTPGKHCRRCLACVRACPTNALDFALTRVMRRYLLRHTKETTAEIYL